MASFSFDDSGFDELINELENIADKAHSLDGSSISFDVLFNTEFMEQNTNVSTFDDFLSQGNFNVETEADFEAIPDDVFDKYVSSNTNFSSWEDMLSAATEVYVESQLGF